MFESMSTYQILFFLLCFGFIFAIIKYAQTYFTFNVFKPYKWEISAKKGQLSKELQKIEHKDTDKVRFHTFWIQIERIKKHNIEGDFAELGVHKGYSANIIHKIDPSRKLHLFDTFSGFDSKDLDKEPNLDEKYSSTTFSDTSLEETKKSLNGNENLVFHKGHFPETAKDLTNAKFSFVHLDADLYNPTLEGLRFFYPKLSEGGVIIIHDYNHTWDGVRNAVDEFSSTIPECIVELSDWQGSAMIIKNKS